MPEELTQCIATLSKPLEPQPTGEEPQLQKIGGMKAVVFDVYGTLLISGSGDISLASENSRGGAVLEALQAVLDEPSAQAVGVTGDEIVELLHQTIHASHAASESQFPEVEIREIWRTVFGKVGHTLSEDQIERFAIEYECRVNPIWPMPRFAETLEGLAKADLKLGIVSNAQFFTPLAFQPLTGKSLEEWRFEAVLCVWSFEHREAKPGKYLYERCAEALARQGIEPQHCLFVGNDFRNDVWPAQQVGFKTALFAGDARSLRWRREDERLSEVRSDVVVTDLGQLLEVVL